MSYVKSINQNNLRIARENLGLDTAEATKKISSSKKNLVAEWENGGSLPTWAQVTKLSKVYDVPELLFFSEDAIPKNKTIPDYRVNADEDESDNARINKLINLVIARQRWLEKNLKEENSPKNQIQGSGRNIESPAELASFISKKLDIDLGEIKKISGMDAQKKVLNYLFKKAEDRGVFVGKTISYHQIKVRDMRGLFISNDYCPFIIINRRDAKSAQIFSFIHELAHLFRKSDAISNSLEFRDVRGAGNDEEVFCNKVAAEFLLPKREFTKEAYDKNDIDRLAEIYKVSKISIFYRLKDLGKLRREIQSQLEREILDETARNVILAETARDKNDGGNYTNSMRDSNGGLFNQVVSRSYLENKIDYVEASHLLRFSVEEV
jgi:Zn-dependent peptidase ImmA (M78 family)/DNA-binding XRE family transcriptional regulator